jgi:cyclic nucleotide gated channel, plant
VGTFWYILSLMRQDDCWHEVCHNTTGCISRYLYCGSESLPGWRNMTELQTQCNSTNFSYGIYTVAIDKGIITSHKFLTKASFCFWWGFQNLRYIAYSQLLLLVRISKISDILSHAFRVRRMLIF